MIMMQLRWQVFGYWTAKTDVWSCVEMWTNMGNEVVPSTSMATAYRSCQRGKFYV